MSFRKRLFKGSIYIFSSMILLEIFKIAKSIINARLLGPSQLGMLSIVQYIGAMFLIFATLNLPIAITKFIAEYKIKDKNQIRAIISTSLITLIVTSFFVFIIIFIYSDFIASTVYNEPQLSIFLKIYAPIMIFSTISNIGISILAGFQRMKKISKINIIVGLISVIILYPMIFYFSLYGAIIVLLLNGITLSALVFIVVKSIPDLRDVFRLEIDRRIAKKMLIYTAPLFISGIVFAISQWFTPTYLASTINFENVGFYRIAISIYSVMLFIPSAIGYNLLPMVSETQASDPRKLPTTIAKILKTVILVLLPFILIACFLSKWVILFFFGSPYIGSVTIAYLMITASFFTSISLILGSILKGIGKTNVTMCIDIVCAILFILSSYFLINIYGIEGAGWSYILSYGVISLIILSYTIRYIRIDWRILAMPFLIAGFSIITAYLIIKTLYGVTLIIGEVILVSLIFFIVINLLEKQEKNLLISILKGITSKKV